MMSTSMVKMPISRSAGLNGNSKESYVDTSTITEIKIRMESVLCGSAKKEQMDNNACKEKEKLIEDVSEFVGMHAVGIIKNAAPGATTKAVEEIKDRITKLDTFVAGELLLIIEQTSNLVFASSEFLKSASSLDNDIFSALLYEIGRTENVAALTDSRLFTKSAANFFNKLGKEAASEWLNSIGMTGSVGALTSKGAMSDDVLGVIDGNAKFASELSYAIGVTREVDALTNAGFLDRLKSLDPVIAAELLSAVWYTKNADNLTTAEVMGKIGSGNLDVWKDLVRAPNNMQITDTPVRVIISKLGGETHDRGAKLIAQSLADSGFDVIYVGNTKSPEELVKIAVKERASAIGFSIMDDSYQHTVADTSKLLKAQGISGISIFGGGLIPQQTAESLQHSDIKMFGQGTTKEDIVGFLNVSALRQQRQSPYVRMDVLNPLIGTSTSNAASRVYAHIPILVVSDGFSYGKVSSYAAQFNDQNTTNVYQPPMQYFATGSTPYFNEQLKKRKKFMLITDTNEGVYWRAKDANGISIRTEAFAIADQFNRQLGAKHKIADDGYGGTSQIGNLIHNEILHNYGIAINSKILTTVASIAPTTLTPSLVPVDASILSSKRINITTVTFDGSVKFVNPESSASRTSNLGREKEASGNLSLQHPVYKISVAGISFDLKEISKKREKPMLNTNDADWRRNADSISIGASMPAIASTANHNANGMYIPNALVYGPNPIKLGVQDAIPYTYSVNINRGLVINLTSIPTQLFYTIATQVITSNSLTWTKRAITVPNQINTSTATTVQISQHPRVEINMPEDVHTSKAFLNIVHILTNIQIKRIQATTQVRHQEDTAIAMKTIPLKSVRMVHPLVIARPEILDSKRMNTTKVKRPIPRGKGLKASISISWCVSIPPLTDETKETKKCENCGHGLISLNVYDIFGMATNGKTSRFKGYHACSVKNCKCVIPKPTFFRILKSRVFSEVIR
jgi:methylmalonyl-CoA mutase C-terminal domain/subunit